MLGRLVAAVLVLTPVPAGAAVRWTPVQNLGESAATVRARADTSGRGVVTWQSASDVRIRTRGTTAWSSAATIAGATLVDLAFTPHGRAAILIRGSGGLAVAGVGAPDPVPGSLDAVQARVARDDAGHVVVVWDEPASGSTVSIRSATRTGATWSPPAFVDVGSGRTWLHDLVISRGAAHLLYGVSAGSSAEYLGSQPLAGGAWTPVTLTETDPGIGGDADLATLGDGRLVALYRLGTRLRVAVGRGSRYSSAVLGPSAGTAITRSALAQDTRGDLIATWSRAGRVWSARRTVAGKAWHALPQFALAGAGAPGLGRLASGEAVLVVRARGRVLAFSRRSGSRAWSGKQTLAASGATGDVALAGAGRLIAAWPAAGGIRASLSRRP